MSRDVVKVSKLAIFGAGGMAKEAAAMVKDINHAAPVFDLVAFVVDNEYYHEGGSIRNIPIYNKEWLLEQKENVVCCCAVGYPKERRKIQKELMGLGVQFANLIHPTAGMREGTSLGTGCIFYPHVGISVDCSIGDGVFLGDYVLIGHDAILQDYATCFPKAQISGKARIGQAAGIGAMAFVGEKIKVGAEAVVSPGSIVLANVKEGTHVIGNPAKRIVL